MSPGLKAPYASTDWFCAWGNVLADLDSWFKSLCHIKQLLHFVVYITVRYKNMRELRREQGMTQERFIVNGSFGRNSWITGIKGLYSH